MVSPVLFRFSVLEESGALSAPTPLSSPSSLLSSSSSSSSPSLTRAPPRHELLQSNLGFGDSYYRVTSDEAERAMLEKEPIVQIAKIAVQQRLFNATDFQYDDSECTCILCLLSVRCFAIDSIMCFLFLFSRWLVCSAMFAT